MRWIMGFHTAVVLLSLLGRASVSQEVKFEEAQLASKGQKKLVNNWKGLQQIDSWEDIKVDLVTPTKVGAPGIEQISAKTIVFHGASGVHELTALSDPHRGMTYIVPGEFSKAIAAKGDVIGVEFRHLPDFVLNRSVFQIKTPPDKERGAISRFVSEYSAEKLDAPSVDAINMLIAAPFAFFGERSSEFASITGISSVTGFSVTPDLVMQMDVLSPGGKFRGVFWIDLNTRQVIKSVIDGKEMRIDSTGQTEPVPVD